MLSDYAATPARVEQVGDGGCDDLAAFADRRPLLPMPGGTGTPVKL